MIAVIQPFGLHSAGGGPRILRGLLQDAPHPFVSINTAPAPQPRTTMGREVQIPVRPSLGKLEYHRIGRVSGRILGHFRRVLSRLFERRLEQFLVAEGVTAVHAIPHDLDFWYAFKVAQRLGLPYYLNVHDDLTYNLQYSTYAGEAMTRLAYVWPRATDVMVISEPMGEEYCRRYGRRPYTLVTDGVADIAPAPLPRPSDSARVYLMGATHLSYEPNYRALLAGLETLKRRRPELAVSFTVRGGLPFTLQSGSVPVTVLPWGTEAEVVQDMAAADLLYLPLPMEEKFAAFSRYSLSTKMITYLGSGLPIFYHGPEWAAASRLLASQGAAAVANTLEPEGLADILLQALKNRSAIVENALALGDRQFRLSEQRRRFWSVVLGHTDAVDQPHDLITAT